MIAYHFPPAAMGSGHLRTLGFARYLPACGWDPIVLTACAIAYPRIGPISQGLIPESCIVHRALAFDARRHFGVGGKYPAFLAQPDRWVSWWPAAVWQGLRLIRRYRVRVIWSTYPIMTAHCIARTLSRVTKLPWIADFRDPVANSVSAENPYSVTSQHRWEKRVLYSAAHAVFTTPGALRSYAERYPAIERAGRLSVIENGYDETAFTDLTTVSSSKPGKPLRLLHSGILYPEGRNPVPFLTALARLKSSGSLGAKDVVVILRASGSESAYAREITRLGLGEMVILAPPVSNREALAEQARADALLLFQGPQYDRQIPAKLYEYLRIDRPIFALVGEQGDTAAVLRRTGGAVLVPPDDVSRIETALREFIQALHQGQGPHARSSEVVKYSRRAGATVLAGLFERVMSERMVVQDVE